MIRREQWSTFLYSDEQSAMVIVSIVYRRQLNLERFDLCSQLPGLGDDILFRAIQAAKQRDMGRENRGGIFLAELQNQMCQLLTYIARRYEPHRKFI